MESSSIVLKLADQAHLIVSCDGGATWSQPVESTGVTAVAAGPAGQTVGLKSGQLVALRLAAGGAATWEPLEPQPTIVPAGVVYWPSGKALVAFTVDCHVLRLDDPQP
jgi:hypothetical protein